MRCWTSSRSTSGTDLEGLYQRRTRPAVEAIVHNTKTLKTGRALEKFPDIITRLRQMVEEFCTALDCVDVGFIPDGLLDALPAACQLGATRVGGIDVNKPRMRAVLAAALALAIARGGFTLDLSGVDLEVCHVSPGSDVAEMPARPARTAARGAAPAGAQRAG